ncbi:hypothetical protein C8Q73DRAFT_88050 [Cubamyces lactineus]|nr:hypothetical protein C8Q73DRAFT_88050 [Cubamyces lactineus]
MKLVPGGRGEGRERRGRGGRGEEGRNHRESGKHAEERRGPGEGEEGAVRDGDGLGVAGKTASTMRNAGKGAHGSSRARGNRRRAGSVGRGAESGDWTGRGWGLKGAGAVSWRWPWWDGRQRAGAGRKSGESDYADEQPRGGAVAMAWTRAAHADGCVHVHAHSCCDRGRGHCGGWDVLSLRPAGAQDATQSIAVRWPKDEGGGRGVGGQGGEQGGLARTDKT